MAGYRKGRRRLSSKRAKVLPESLLRHNTRITARAARRRDHRHRTARRCWRLDGRIDLRRRTDDAAGLGEPVAQVAAVRLFGTEFTALPDRRAILPAGVRIELLGFGRDRRIDLGRLLRRGQRRRQNHGRQRQAENMAFPDHRSLLRLHNVQAGAGVPFSRCARNGSVKNAPTAASAVVR